MRQVNYQHSAEVDEGVVGSAGGGGREGGEVVVVEVVEGKVYKVSD